MSPLHMTTTTIILKTQQEVIERFGTPNFETSEATLEAVKNFMFPVIELRVKRCKQDPEK